MSSDAAEYVYVRNVGCKACGVFAAPGAYACSDSRAVSETREAGPATCGSGVSGPEQWHRPLDLPTVMTRIRIRTGS